MYTVSDNEMKKVIADFLEMGHVDNIIALFRREPRYYDWTGELLQDERFAVRLGLNVLFEELCAIDPAPPARALSSLRGSLEHESPLIRGEAVGLLGIIGGEEAIRLIRAMEDDDSAQVREMVQLALAETEPDRPPAG